MVDSRLDPYNCDAELADINDCAKFASELADMYVRWQDRTSRYSAGLVFQAFTRFVCAIDAGVSAATSIADAISDTLNDDPEDDGAPF